MFNNYIIDLDGTIIDSSNQILFCIDKAFKKVGYKIDKNKLTSNIIGPPIKEIIALLAPELYDENIINSIIKNFRQLYDNEENDISELYVGLYDFLRELKYKQKKLFIATLKPEKIKIKNNIKTQIAPTSPNSSPIIEKIKSLSENGKKEYFALELKSPTPNQPPEPKEYSD